MEKQHRNVLVLSATQATLQITGVTMVAITGLAGYALADNKSFATVPLTCYVLGSAITTIPASFLMKAIGRRAGFQVGTLIGMLGGAICSFGKRITGKPRDGDHRDAGDLQRRLGGRQDENVAVLFFHVTQSSRRQS